MKAEIVDNNKTPEFQPYQIILDIETKDDALTLLKYLNHYITSYEDDHEIMKPHIRASTSDLFSAICDGLEKQNVAWRQ